MTDYPDLTFARVLADSVTRSGCRITTVEATFPRFVLAEFNTHKSLARNSASSRAIPVDRQLQMVTEHPFVPQQFPINRPGMSAAEYVGPEDPRYLNLRNEWLAASRNAVATASYLFENRVHKQIANRVLEPFMWHAVIATATWDEWDWPNFFSLRISEHAQPEIRRAAEAIKAACDASEPQLLDNDEWHLPLIDADDDRPLDQKIRSSVARCAAVSYNRHRVQDLDKEYARYDSLATQRHLSPFEHAAHPQAGRNGPFTGWRNGRWYVERQIDPLSRGESAVR